MKVLKEDYLNRKDPRPDTPTSPLLNSSLSCKSNSVCRSKIGEISIAKIKARRAKARQNRMKRMSVFQRKMNNIMRSLSKTSDKKITSTKPTPINFEKKGQHNEYVGQLGANSPTLSPKHVPKSKVKSSLNVLLYRKIK